MKLHTIILRLILRQERIKYIMRGERGVTGERGGKKKVTEERRKKKREEGKDKWREDRRKMWRERKELSRVEGKKRERK